MTRYELAIDPGATGGAWLGTTDHFGGAFTLMAWTWKPCKRGGKLKYKVVVGGSAALNECTFDNLHAVGCYIREGIAMSDARGGYRLTIEGLFGRGHTLERLSWYAGLLAGPLLGAAIGAVERPLAMQWRLNLLGIGPRTPSEVCDEKVIDWVGKACPSLPLALRNSHVCDSIALAAWRAKNDHG